VRTRTTCGPGGGQVGRVESGGQQDTEVDQRVRTARKVGVAALGRKPVRCDGASEVFLLIQHDPEVISALRSCPGVAAVDCRLKGGPGVCEVPVLREHRPQRDRRHRRVLLVAPVDGALVVGTGTLDVSLIA
jgi:hypothetical protein